MTIRAAVLWAILVVVPLVPLTLAWVRVLKLEDGTGFPTVHARVELALITVSFLLFLSGLIWAPILGPYYSERRLGTIYANFVIMALAAVASAFGTKHLKRQLIATAIVLTLIWAYMAVVNSVV